MRLNTHFLHGTFLHERKCKNACINACKTRVGEHHLALTMNSIHECDLKRKISSFQHLQPQPGQEVKA